MADDEEIKEEIPPIGVYHGERNEDLLRHGQGSNQFPNGDTYNGAYVLGKRHGKGTYIWKATKARYSGDYIENVRDGQGEFIYPDGSKYTGTFSAGKRHGFGAYVYPNGDVYEGAWENDVKHGAGVYTYAKINVKKSGVWKNGVLEGAGEVTFPQAIVKGTFVDNESMQENVQVQFLNLDKHSVDIRDPSSVGLKQLVAA